MTRNLLASVAALMTVGCSAAVVPVTALRRDAVPLVVETAAGNVRGSASSQGELFLGIPYAAPPVGPLRFAPPASPAPWQGVRDARTAGAACPQPKSPFAADVAAAEDCLNLNVYAPTGTSAASRLPVMIWIHGGGFTNGSNTQGDASVFAERQKVVVVAINYRLGALGFLASPAFGPGRGNFGLLDQQAALKWVRRNIQAFGGDPAKVTLVGESSGAGSACTHLALPGSRGLFRGVILESGPCISGDALTSRAEAEAGAVAMAAGLGCTGADVVACLRAQPLNKLLAAKSRRRGNNGADGWAPMIGGDVLPRSPREAFLAGDVARVPVLAGSNYDEGRLFSNLLAFTGAFLTNARYEKTFALGLEHKWIAPTIAEYREAARRSRSAALADVVTDSHFACPLVTLHQLLGPKTPFYAYEFHDPHAPTKIWQAPFSAPQSSFHASEIVYIFQTASQIADPKKFDAAQWRLSNRIQDYWGSFIRTGQPTAAGGPAWPVFDGRRPLLLAPPSTIVAGNFATRHRCAFWKTQGI